VIRPRKQAKRGSEGESLERLRLVIEKLHDN